MKIENIEQFEKENEGLVLADFYADWCGPCKMLLPVIADVEKMNTGAKVLKINIDEMEELAAKYSVSTIPTLIYFKDGQEVKRTIGFKTKDEIIKTIESLK